MNNNNYGGFFNNFDSNSLTNYTNQGGLGEFFGLSNYTTPGLDQNALSLDAAPIRQTPDLGDKGGFNFDKLAQGIGIGKDVLAGIMALKQFSMAKDAFNHQKGIDLANLSNQAKLAQNQLDLQNRRRQVEGGGYFDGIANPELQQTT